MLDSPITRFTSFVLIVSAIIACAPRSPAQSPSVILSIVGTNDLHGGVLPTDGRGGLALLDGYLRNLRAARVRDGGSVLLVDAGDLFQGTLESNLNEGAVVIAAYNEMRYDAAAIGNHEFDFGPVGPAVVPASGDDPRGALKARAAEARFPFLAANIVDTHTGRPVSWEHVQPSTLLTVDGIKVGVVGLTTTETLAATLTANTRDLAVSPLAPALEAEARRLRGQGATIVVAAAHAGGQCTKFDNPADVSSCTADSEIFNVARALPGGLVDVIVAGHRHEGIAHEVAGIPVVSSYSSGRAFGRVDLTVDRASGRVRAHRIFPPHDLCEREDPATGRCMPAPTGVPAQYEGAAVEPGQEIQAILAPAVAASADLKRQSLAATIEDTLPDVGDESALGNLLADWTRAAAGGVDVAIANTGGVRSALPAGPLTYGRLFGVTPFDNREVRLTMTGAELATVVRNNLERRGDMIALSGVRAAATCGDDGLRVSLRRESGRLIGDRERLRVVTSDFLATGGSGILTPVMPLRQTTIAGPILRDQIAQWLARSSRTWRARDLFGPEKRRLVYDGTRPVRCAAR